MQMISESVSQIVYHISSWRNVASIIRNKKFLLTGAIGNKSEETYSKKTYYLSLARNKTSDYIIHNDFHAATMKLNGDFFNRNSQGKPVDYWERAWINAREKGGDKSRFREMEDRVFSDSNVIEFSDVSDVILEVHIHVSENKFNDPDFKKLLITSVKARIPTFVYTERKDFVLQNKSKAIPLKDVVAQINIDTTPLKRNPQFPRKDYLAPISELLYTDDQSKLSNEADKLRYTIKYYLDDARRGISADFHNSRTRDRESYAKAVRNMRKFGIKNLTELLDFLKNKWGQP